MDPQFKAQLTEALKRGNLADKQDKERAELFEMLLNNPAWKLYSELLSALIQIKADEIMFPANSADRAFALEYVKGAMSGLIMARDLPSVIVTAMKPAVPATDGEE